MATPTTKSRAKKAPDAAPDEAPAVANTVMPSITNKKDAHTMTSILEFSEDLSQAEAPVPLPVSDYPAEIRGAKIAQSKASGKDMIEVQFYIDADDYPADYTEGDPDGTMLTYYLSNAVDTPAGRYKVRKFIENVGGKLGKSLDPNDLIGLTGTVSIAHEEYEGETRAKISRVVAA